jgi:hypothetical protein
MSRTRQCSRARPWALTLAMQGPVSSGPVDCCASPRSRRPWTARNSVWGCSRGLDALRRPLSSKADLGIEGRVRSIVMATGVTSNGYRTAAVPKGIRIAAPRRDGVGIWGHLFAALLHELLHGMSTGIGALAQLCASAQYGAPDQDLRAYAVSGVNGHADLLDQRCEARRLVRDRHAARSRRASSDIAVGSVPQPGHPHD